MSRRDATAPTRFDELNDVLADLTARAREILGPSFVGAYLQGSFAVGDADLHSDCDFLVPVRDPVTDTQESALRALHDELPTRPGHWTKHLEGSYPLAEELRSLQHLDARWLYIDHGWREMQWSTHCNTEVARWSLRERGITLAGPAPKTLVDPVPPSALRARMREQIPTAVEDIEGWISLDVAWGQRYAVSTLCRMLYTLATAEVCSKKAALEWAGQSLEPRWAPLLAQVLGDRERGFDAEEPARPGSVRDTRALAAHAAALAANAGARGERAGSGARGAAARAPRRPVT
jgi:predicted nucleotidyltransferase